VTAWEHHVPLAFHSGREAGHSPPSGAEIEGWVELYLHSPNASSWRGTELGEHRDNFIFCFITAAILQVHWFQEVSI